MPIVDGKWLFNWQARDLPQRPPPISCAGANGYHRYCDGRIYGDEREDAIPLSDGRFRCLRCDRGLLQEEADWASIKKGTVLPTRVYDDGPGDYYHAYYLVLKKNPKSLRVIPCDEAGNLKSCIQQIIHREKDNWLWHQGFYYAREAAGAAE